MNAGPTHACAADRGSGEAMWLPGKADPRAWRDDVVATLRTPPFVGTSIGISIFQNDEFVARNDAPLHRAVARAITNPGGRALRDDALFDAYSRWALDPNLPPVRAWSRIIPVPTHDGTGVVNLATLRATTGPGVIPLFVTYAWTAPRRSVPETPLPLEHWVRADEHDVIDAATMTSSPTLGVTRWMLMHPEDVVATLDTQHALRNGDALEHSTAVRVITSSGWARTIADQRALIRRGACDLASWNRPPRGRPIREIPEPIDELTARELEVFRLLLAGVAGVTIADRLDVRPSTVRTMTARILAKLHVQDRAELRARYDPSARSAIEVAVLATRGFSEALPVAQHQEPRFVRFDGSRDEWVEALARTVASPLLAGSPIGVALIDRERIAAANRAFSRSESLPLDGFDLDLVDPADERSSWRAASEGARGAWSFAMQRGKRVLVVSVVSRNDDERAVAFVYVSDTDRHATVPTSTGWLLLDRSWRIRGATSVAAPPRLMDGLEGAVLWPFVHPGRLPVLIDAFESVVAGESDDIEIIHDSLRRGGWSAARSRLRRVIDRQGEPFVLWEFGPSLTGSALTPDPAVVASVPERDRALAVAALAGATVADLSAEFDLAPGTVRNRLSGVYRALGVHSQRELVERFGHWR